MRKGIRVEIVVVRDKSSYSGGNGRVPPAAVSKYSDWLIVYFRL